MKMQSYEEYDRIVKGDLYSYEFIWESKGHITINEDLVESEKICTITQDDSKYQFRFVRMASGAEHYLLIKLDGVNVKVVR